MYNLMILVLKYTMQLFDFRSFASKSQIFVLY